MECFAQVWQKEELKVGWAGQTSWAEGAIARVSNLGWVNGWFAGIAADRNQCGLQIIRFTPSLCRR